MMKIFIICAINAFSLFSTAEYAGSSATSYGNNSSTEIAKQQSFSNNGNKTAYQQMMEQIDGKPEAQPNRAGTTVGIDAETHTPRQGAFEGSGNVFRD